VAVGQLTHKVIAIEHVTKQEERSSQRHETVGTSRMYDNFAAKGVVVRDHAHDRNVSVNRQIKERGVNNSNDRWHVAKSVGSDMKKITCGTKKWHGKKWHTELADKASGVRNHFYWSMENANGDPKRLREMLDSIIYHYQNDHSRCVDEKSSCKQPNYVPPWFIIKDKVAVDLLTKFVHGTTVYRNAADYVYGRDTFYVESFNNVCLIYLDKRLHYKDEMYKCRSNLAILDWNEHVGRPASSVRHHMDAARARKAKGKRILTTKTFSFVKDLWSLLCASANTVCGPPIGETVDDDNNNCENSSASDEFDIERD
jgi:hypothetical protein